MQNPVTKFIRVHDVQRQFDFAKTMLTMIDRDGFNIGCLCFTDKGHFHFKSFVNKHNWRYWGVENPYLCEATPLHSPKVTVWAAVCRKGFIIFFFMSGTGRYLAILEQFLATQQSLEEPSYTEWFMQDGPNYIVAKRSFT